MSWKGKAIGLILGLLTRRPQLMVIGLILGHLYDMGVFSGRPAGPAAASPPPSPPPATVAASDPYLVLGTTASASDDDVELAYRRRMSEYHPDRVANAAVEIRELADQRAREINGAYEQIKRQRGL